jgi:hypothetical protein
MHRRAVTLALATFALLSGTAVVIAQQSGSAAEAKAMLDRAVSALSQ